jgi:RNA polymerase sigma-70 factor (ECF subfamily)
MSRPNRPVVPHLHVESADPTDLSDEVLVARVRSGDNAAFERMFRKYCKDLCGFAYGYVRAHALAEEIVHDVFAMIWAEREQFQVRGHLSGYLHTLVRNTAITALRRQITEQRLCATMQREPEEAPLDIHDELDHAALIHDLARTMAELPERCRTALILRWQRRMSYAEIAEAMGISVKTVEVHLARGIKMLRERFHR